MMLTDSFHFETRPLLRNVPCPHCTYNLRGLDGRIIVCPECGNSYSRLPHRPAPQPNVPLDPEMPIEFDLHCPTCQASLHGLTGEPIRCGDCADAFARHALKHQYRRFKSLRWMPPSAKAREVKHLVNMGALLALAVGVVGPLALVEWLLANETFGRVSGGLYVVGFAIGFLGMILILIASRGRRHHLKQLGTYQLVAILSWYVNGGMLLALPYAAALWGAEVDAALGYVLAVPISVPGVFLIIFRPIPVFRKTGIRLLLPLADERLARRAARRTGAKAEAKRDD